MASRTNDLPSRRKCSSAICRLPEDIKKDYEEARSIVSTSPRSSAALLRLTIQKLTDTILGKDKTESLNTTNIELLVKKGLQSDIQKHWML
jgi:hypothetical protein